MRIAHLLAALVIGSVGLVGLAPFAHAQEKGPDWGDLVTRAAIKGLEVGSRDIQYLDFGQFFFAGARPANSVFLPARYIVPSPIAGDSHAYWVLDVFRVGFNAGMHDHWQDALTASHGPADISFLRIYEVIKVTPVTDPTQALKEAVKIYDPRTAVTNAFKTATEETLSELKPGQALVVNRYIGAGASASYLFAPTPVAVGAKVSLTGDLMRQGGAVYLKTSDNEIVASWRQRKSQSLQAALKAQAFFLSFPLLAEQLRKDAVDDQAYAFDLTVPEQKQALLGALVSIAPSFDPALGLQAQTREMRVRGEYRIASLFGFATRRWSRESVDVKFGDPGRGISRDIQGSVRRKEGGTERTIEAVRVGEKDYLRVEVSLHENAASAEELERLEARARDWFPVPVRMPGRDSFPQLSGQVRLTTSVLYPEDALADIFNPRRSVEGVCARFETALPDGAWCQWLRELPSDVDVFNYSLHSIRDPDQARVFRETLIGLRSFLSAYARAQKQFALEQSEKGISGTEGSKRDLARTHASLDAMSGVLLPGPLLVPAIHTLDQLTSESRIYRQARLTAQGVDLDAIGTQSGGYEPSPQEMGELIAKAAETEVDSVYRAIQPVLFDYFELVHTDRQK